MEKEKFNSKNIWKIINNLCKPQTEKMSISEIKINGNIINDKLEIAKEFNNFFINVGTNLDSQINTNINYQNYLNDNLNSIYLYNTNENEISKIIKNLKDKKSYGNDGIPIRAYKLGTNRLSMEISKLINISFKLGTFPNCLKIAKIIPVFKSGKRNQINNYRPISILNTLSKIFEECMKIRITHFLERNNLITNSQFGFRTKHSTSTALIALTNFIYKNLDENKQVTTIFIDLKKAFDTVNHKILLYKLEKIGIRGITLQWVKSYICERRQYTIIDDITSDREELTVGLPQGGKLSPILYLIYVNDINNFTQCDTTNLILFADDTSITICSNKKENLENNANMQLNLLKN